MDARLATARNLLLDCLAVEVAGSLAAVGIRTVLLKGAAIAGCLYDDGAARPYGDVDLLVSPADFAAAEEVLAAGGFALRRPGLSTLEETVHARVWVRRNGSVDLHHRLWGVGADPAEAWPLLTATTETLRIGDGHVEVLALPARALHVALHAAQHGGRETKPRQDLGRAGSRLALHTWREAAELARHLKAEGAMAAGMRLHPTTAPLVDQLGLAGAAPLAVRLHANDAPLCSLGLARLLATQGLKAKGAMAARRLIPTPARMRAQYPFAARDSGALALAYARRTVSLALQAPAALVAIRRAGKPVRSSAPRGPMIHDERTGA